MANQPKTQLKEVETEAPQTSLNGSNTLNIGAPGSGKTDVIATFVAAGIKPVIVFTEPGGHESLLDSLERRGLSNKEVYWCYVAPRVPTWDNMMKAAKIVSSLSYKGLTEIKQDPNWQDYQQFIDLLNALSEFTDDRTGEVLGPIDELDNTYAFILDGLTGLNMMCKDLMIGGKPVCHEGEWGVAMDQEERLLQKLCCDTKCFFVLNAHVERIENPLTGGLQMQAGALGRKLAPRIPRFFSDVLISYKEAGDFYWSTAMIQADLKTRLLPIGDKLEPTYEQIVTRWRELGELAEGEAA